MKLTTQGIMMQGKCHVLYSPQKGTLCGIKKWCDKKDIIQISNLEEITCEACKLSVLKTLSILSTISANH